MERGRSKIIRVGKQPKRIGCRVVDVEVAGDQAWESKVLKGNLGRDGSGVVGEYAGVNVGNPKLGGRGAEAAPGGVYVQLDGVKRVLLENGEYRVLGT